MDRSKEATTKARKQYIKARSDENIWKERIEGRCGYKKKAQMNKERPRHKSNTSRERNQ
jgi:hypothetical protein